MSQPGAYRRRLLLMGIGGAIGVFISLAGFGLTMNNQSAVVLGLSLPGRLLSHAASSVGITSGPLVFIAFIAGQFIGWALAFGLLMVLLDAVRGRPKKA